MDSFIVKLWLGILRLLRMLSPFDWLCLAVPKLSTSYGAVEVWVLAHLGLCIALLYGAQHLAFRVSEPWHLAICVYGGLRILEIVVVNALVLLDIAAQGGNTQGVPPLRGYRRILLLAFHNYIEVILWFAVIFVCFPQHFNAAQCGANKSLCGVYFSLVTMATVGYGDIYPSDDWGRALVGTQVAVAIFLTLVILARVVAYIPQPPSLDPDEQKR